MGRIQSSIGAITGVPITDTVDKLLSLSAVPRDRLVTRTEALKQQQVAVTELTALTIGMQLAATKLASNSLYEQRTVSSSNEAALAATVTGSPVPGVYHFTPVRTAQTHHLISQGVGSLDEPLDGGELRMGFGAVVNDAIALETLNGGNGVQRGKIRVTDRSGASEIIDLRYAFTIDDVLNAINNSDNLNVMAVADGDALQLIDLTGQADSNLMVQEVGLGTTAADLGLSGINVAASEATGQDILHLFDNLRLSGLNDGSGLSFRNGQPDLEIAFRDGNALQVDLQPAELRKVGDLLEALNAADPTRLRAQISADGERIELVDLTSGSGTFSVASSDGGNLAEDLGVAGADAGGVLSGRRLLGGLKSSLLTSLSGGHGLGQLGQIALTDRAGNSANVDLSAAETLDDVISAINATGLAITAGVNSARNGIVLRDSSGATTSHFIVANADATNTADILGITADSEANVIDGGSLHLQAFHENLSLDQLNHGRGVALGSIIITDSTGNSSGINLASLEAKTVGDVMDAINELNIGVTARLNDTGDGLLLVDTAGGFDTMTVEEAGSATTAADLGILGEAKTIDFGGTPTQVIDGAKTSQLTLEGGETIADLVEKLNALDAGVTASIFNAGGGDTPYRISLISNTSGRAGEIQLDTSGFGLDFFEIAPAEDALLLVGSATTPGAGILTSSPDNRFDELIEGVELTVNGPSDVPVRIEVDESNESLISGVQLLVDQYNHLQDKIDELTFFDENSGSTGILFGSNETLRIETTMSNLLTSRFFGVGDVQSLEQVGLSLDDKGRLEFDTDNLERRLQEDLEAVQQFFTDEEFGFVKKFEDAVDSLAGEGHSLLVSRSDTLQRRIENNSDKIQFMNTRLEAERDRLLLQFYNMETSIAKLQGNLQAIQSLAPLPVFSGGGQ
jgi:flagellar hook-associated protein 2